jgi:hypothetical protein
VLAPFKNLCTWLAVEPHHRIGIRLLQAAIGLMLLFRISTEWHFASYFWGPNGIGQGSTALVLGPALASLIDPVFDTEIGVRCIIFALAVGALGLVLGRATRLSTGLALCSFFLLEQRLPELPDGGDNITRISLMYLLFVLPPSARPIKGSLSIWLHNVAVLAVVFQTAILYFTSGAMKMFGDKWQHGVAMYYVSQVEWFSLPTFRSLYKNPEVASFVVYGTMLFQIWFPIALLSPLRLAWIAGGVIFHLGIAFFMGLITFSLVMIGLELALISDVEYARIRSGASRIFSRPGHTRLRTQQLTTTRSWTNSVCHTPDALLPTSSEPS